MPVISSFVLRMSLALTALLGLALSTACGPPQSGFERAPVGPLSTIATPVAYRLELTIDPAKPRFSGIADIDVDLSTATRTVFLHAQGLTFTKVTVVDSAGNSPRARAHRTNALGVLRLSFDRMVPAGATKLHFEYDAPFADDLDGLYVTRSADKPYAVTQLEAISARRMFPSFDEPRFKTPFDISVVAPSALTVLGNTLPKKVEVVGNGQTRYTLHQTKPLPTYLVALAVGPYAVRAGADIAPQDPRDTPIPFRVGAVAEKGDQLDYALQITPGIVLALERYFGTAYPYEKLDMLSPPDFAAGAMENAGLITYRESHMLHDGTSSITRRRDFISTNAHELGHQWFGNLVTPAWWDDIWLNESFATWISYKISAEVAPEGAFERETQRDALRAMAVDGFASQRAIRTPILRNENIEEAFDLITYQKGGGVLAMVERFVGADAFRAGVRLHMQRFAFKSATTKDFLASIAEGSGRPEVVPIFESFLNQTGLPLLELTVDCSTPDQPVITLSQSRWTPLGSELKPDAQLWTIPACLSILSAKGASETCIVMSERRRTINLPKSACPIAVLPNAAGAGYYRFSLPEAQWRALINVVDRLPPAEQLSLADSLVAAFRAGQLSSDTLLDGVQALARLGAWDASTFATTANGRAGAAPLLSLIEDLAPNADVARGQFIRAAFGPRLEGAAKLPGHAGRLFVTRLTSSLAFDGDDETVRATLANAGALELGLAVTGDGVPLSLDPDLRGARLRAFVEVFGARGFDTVYKAVGASNDQTFRAEGLRALAASVDSSRRALLFKVLLNDDLKLTARERYEVVQLLMNAPSSRAVTWKWLQANISAFAKTLTPARRADLPLLTRRFCNASQVPEITKFFTSQASLIGPPGRSLNLAVEQIKLCAALKAARSEEFTRSLIKHLPPETAAPDEPRAPATTPLPSLGPGLGGIDTMRPLASPLNTPVTSAPEEAPPPP